MKNGRCDSVAVGGPLLFLKNSHGVLRLDRDGLSRGIGRKTCFIASLME
ncbi:MAG: hypothetical protein NTY66_01530 [Candidatus Vogelbacteria bacterium]|nr:hypothetical protein [Candidatus Vogelbacteria bacterium]